MYKLYNKKTIEGLSPLVVEKAEKDYIDTLIRGYTKQTTNLSDGLLEQGTIIAEGDKDATNRVRTTNLIKVIPNTKIVVNASVDGNISLEYYVYYYDISNNYVTNILGWKSVGTEIIIPNDNNIKFCRLIIRKNDNSTIIPTDISNFNVGNTPSPDYPSRIRNIGDNVNLFNGIFESTTKNGITSKYSDGILTLNGTATEQTDIVWNGNFTMKANTSYIITSYYQSGTITGSAMFYGQNSTNWLGFNLSLGNSNTSQIRDEYYTNNNLDFNVNKFIRITSGTIFDNYKIKIKIAESSIETPWTPYGCGSIDYEIENENIFSSDLEIGEINNTTGLNVSNGNAIRTKDYIKVKPNTTYTLKNSNNYMNVVYFYSADKTYINYSYSTDTSYTFTTGTTAEYIRVRSSSVNSQNDLTTKYMLVEGSIAKPYVEHQEQTIHFPLSKGQLLHEGDYLASDGIHQNKKTIIINGTENISYENNMILIKETGLNQKKYEDGGKCISNYFKYVSPNSGNGIWIGNATPILIKDSKFTSATSFITWAKARYEEGTPLKIEYELAEEIITPLTAEQQNVIDNIELFEGYNQINSLDEFDFEMKIIYTPQFTEDIRKAFRTGITKAYLEVIGTDVVIDYQNYLKNIEFSELRFVPDKGIFGQAVAKKIVVNFNNLDNTLNLQDKEIRLFIETEVDEENYRIKYGDFIVQHPENENVNDNTSLTGLDYMIKTNVKYVDTITYPCTLRQLANNICTQCGLTLSKESFKNENFVVENNQFVSGETCRQIIQGIALSAFSWARIDENNELHFDFDKDFSIKEELTNDEYYNLDFNKELYGPTNRIIIRDSQIDGENVTISDDESIATNGVNEIVIEDNPFAYTQEKREQLIEAGKDLFGFSYLPINSSKLIGYIYLNCLDRIKIKNMQGQSFETYLFNHIINYEGTALDTIEVPAMTKTETKYTFTPDITQALKNTQVIVDKANQTITGIIEKQEGQSNQITSIEASLDGINTKIQDNQDDINERFNKIETTLEGTTQVLSNKGGNNIFYYAKEFWTDGTENGTAKLNEYTDTEVQKISVSGNGYKINKGTSEQKVNVKNDIYTISFTYKKLVDLAIGYVLINNERIDLSSSAWKEEVITLNIDTNNVDFKIISDTDNAFEIYDLMGTIGEEKQIWTQNPNETRTDTVTIGKGIEVKSSSKNTYARFDADGNRIFNNSTNQVVTALTDKGVETNEIDSELGKIGGILIQKMSGQTWISSLL